MRDEGNGKLTVLGFAGILPDVQLYVGDASLALQIAFIFVCGRGSGKFSTTFRVTKEGSAAPFLATAPSDGNFLPQKSSTNVSYQLIGAFPGAGKYRVELLADGKPQYSSTFQLIEGTPPP